MVEPSKEACYPIYKQGISAQSERLSLAGFSRIYHTTKPGLVNFTLTSDAPINALLPNENGYSFTIKLDLALPPPADKKRALGSFTLSFVNGGTPATGLVYYNGKSFVLSGHVAAAGATASLATRGDLYATGCYLTC